MPRWQKNDEGIRMQRHRARLIVQGLVPDGDARRRSRFPDSVRQNGALIVVPDACFLAKSVQIADLARRYETDRQVFDGEYGCQRREA
jgi:hypothetical protein